jgi:hypothetical protein
MLRRQITRIKVSAMSGKNDRFILAGMIAIGVVAIAIMGAAFGIGAFIYLSEPEASPTPAPTPAPAPTSTPAPTIAPVEEKNPFDMDSLVSNRADRTYTLKVRLADGSESVDMSKVTAEIIAGDRTYPAWDYLHAGHSWNMGSNGDTFLDSWETFTMVIYTPQAGLPMDASSPVKLVLLSDYVPAFSVNVTAV